MRPHARFVTGTAAVAVGSAAMSTAYLLDPALLGPVTPVGAVGAGMAALGTSIVTGIAVLNPEQFSFEGATPAAFAPTGTAFAGLVSLGVGAVTLALALS